MRIRASCLNGRSCVAQPPRAVRQHIRTLTLDTTDLSEFVVGSGRKSEQF